MASHRWLTLLTTIAGACALANGAPAAEPRAAELASEDRIAELERKVEVLAGELERTRSESVLPAETGLSSSYGLGPAASKVYGLTQGLSLGGYGEAFYRRFVNERGTTQDRADMLRAVLYLGYKFSDRIVFNSEIEFEHATTGKEGSVSVEFAALDFLWKDAVNARAGLLLVPVGWLNTIHEPPFFYGVNRPDVERVIIPSTWRSNGAGIFGTLAEQLDYSLYVTTGFDASGFAPSGVRGGRQSGSQELAEHLGVAGRLDWTGLPGVVVGASFFTGEAGQNRNFTSASMPGLTVQLPDARTTIWDVHAQWRWRGLHLRGLFTMAHVDEARELTLKLRDAVASGTSPLLAPTQSVAQSMLGAYAEAAYDLWPLLGFESERSLEPYYRYEFYDTQWVVPSGLAEDPSREVQVHTVGIQFKPIPNVVLKTDYRNRASRRGSIADEWNVGIGYAF